MQLRQRNLALAESKTLRRSLCRVYFSLFKGKARIVQTKVWPAIQSQEEQQRRCWAADDQLQIVLTERKYTKINKTCKCLQAEILIYFHLGWPNETDQQVIFFALNSNRHIAKKHNSAFWVWDTIISNLSLSSRSERQQLPSEVFIRHDCQP